MESTLPRSIKNVLVECFIYNGIMVAGGSVERMIKGFVVIGRRDEKEGAHSEKLKK